jgi:hypothetical protein
VSYSWFDPHFHGLYARRQEERLAEKLAARLRERTPCESSPRAVHPGGAGSSDDVVAVPGRHLRLL